jgi:hypothetical protein
MWGHIQMLVVSKNTLSSSTCRIRSGTFRGSYGVSETSAIRSAVGRGSTHFDLLDKRVLVIGSQQPWIEAVVLEAGAKEVVTIDYANVTSRHPKVTAQSSTTMNFLVYEKKKIRRDRWPAGPVS